MVRSSQVKSNLFIQHSGVFVYLYVRVELRVLAIKESFD